MSVYLLKARFQSLLRPLVRILHDLGVTANQVTLAACVISVAVGVILMRAPIERALFLLVPVWMFARMALNAVDGMLAREFGHKSPLGAYLNELTDVVSDAALYLPFALLAPFSAWSVGGVIFFAALGEFAGVVAATTGASRRYDGPMGKSDRALAFGILGAWVGLGSELPQWTAWIMWAIAALAAVTVVNRVRRGLLELKDKGEGK